MGVFSKFMGDKPLPVVRKVPKNSTEGKSAMMNLQKEFLANANAMCSHEFEDYVIITQTNNGEGMASALMCGTTGPQAVLLRIMSLEKMVELSYQKLYAMMLSDGFSEADAEDAMDTFKEMVAKMKEDGGTQRIQLKDNNDYVAKMGDIMGKPKEKVN